MEAISIPCSTKENRMQIKLLMGALALAASGAAFAQPAVPAQPAAPGNPTAMPRVEQREARQEGRIQQGVNSGQLTPRETRRLQGEQARIERAENHAQADGKVSAQERARLRNMQDRASRDIYREKHDRQRDLNRDGRRDRPQAQRAERAEHARRR